MIDLHAHILPGIDDGPDDLTGSLAMAQAAWESGTHLIAATPHLRDDHPRVRPQELAGRCLALEEALARHAIELRVLPAAEVDLLWGASATPEQLRLATFAQRGTDMLVETPYGALLPTFDQALWRVMAQGIRVLLAHPERNPTFQRRPELVLELVRRGVLVQITAASLVSDDRRSQSRRVARWLVEQRAAHVIASDAHTAGPWRGGPDLRPAAAAAAKLGPARAEWMLHEVPQAIVAGEPLPPMPVDMRRRPRPRMLERLGLL